MITVLQIILFMFIMLVFTGTEYLIYEYLPKFKTTAIIVNILFFFVSVILATDILHRYA